MQNFNANTQATPVPIHAEEFGALQQGRFRQEHGIPPSAPMILSVARITPHKGQDVLVRAAFEVLSQRSDAYFVLAGAVSDREYYRDLQQQVRDRGWDERILFTGEVSRQVILDAYADCSFHVVPVRFMNAGAVIIEAWAAGKANLQSVHVDPSHIQPGINGDTFRLEPQELAQKILHWLQEPEAVAQMGQQGQELALKQFTYAKVVADILKLYQDSVAWDESKKRF